MVFIFEMAEFSPPAQHEYKLNKYIISRLGSWF